MRVPFPLIDADDPIVGDLLLGTVDLVREAGGWISPNATLIARDGQLSIQCTDDEGLLLRIPREAMIRVDRVTWSDDPERLVIEDVPEDFGDIETSMLYTQVALLNQCGKLPLLRTEHPALADALDPATIDLMRSLLPSFRTKPITPRSLLFVTRCFRIDVEDGAGPQRIVIPLVDLLNHHRQGAVANWLGTSFDVATRRPFGTSECALDYGMARDALEMAAVYGFVDESADIAHSAPVEVDVEGIGRIAVVGSLRTRSGEVEEPVAIEEPSRVLITGLTFHRDAPAAATDAMARATGWGITEATRAVTAVADANLALLAELRRSLGTDPSPVARLLRSAAEHQARVIG